MKQPDDAANGQSVQMLTVEPDAREVLSDREITEILISHLRGCNEMVKMFRKSDFHQKILETSVHQSRCGRKFLITAEYDCSITTLELINEQ